MRNRQAVKATPRTEIELLAQIAEDVRDIRKLLNTWWVLFWIGLGVVFIATAANA